MRYDAHIRGMESFEMAPYFKDRVLNNPQRQHLIPFVAITVNEPEETLSQRDGKIRHFRYVPELGRHVRVITRADGALFNVHEDSNYARKQRRSE